MEIFNKIINKSFEKGRCVTFLLKSRVKTFLGFKNPKVFVIGRNKTGTTSLARALEILGYRIGNQRRAELLMEDWGKREFRRIINYCHSADAFQDVPFSYPYTFQALDSAFPGSKFILSIRESAEVWYQSLVRFHSKRLEKRIGEFRTPNFEDIKNDPYVYPGYLWRVRQLVGVGAENDPWLEVEMKQYYERHNEMVVDYFRNRPQDLLILNIGGSDSMHKLCLFLGKRESDHHPMPFLNQSKNGD